MPSFSPKSLENLNGSDNHLQVLFSEVIKHRDCIVTEGHRSPERQLQLFAEGKTKVKVGKHNSTPSMAVDVVPCVNGKPSYDMVTCYAFGGFVLGMAAAMNLGGRIRWGGDWDGDSDLKDQTFNDLVHFEMK